MKTAVKTYSRSLVLHGMTYPYELSKSRRKSIAIQIRPEGTLHVKAPMWVSVKEIEGFLRQKEDWIVQTLRRVSEVRSTMPVREFVHGDRLSFLGQDFFLEIREEPDRKRSHIKIAQDKMILMLPFGTEAETRKNILRNWYREQAREILMAKTERFSKMLGVTYSNIYIKEQKSRWGSCSSRGNLNFNWHIIMAPETIADYLVIHELCHLRHMNHSPEFWNCVGSLYPDFRKARKWLKDNGNSLRNW